MPTDFEKLEETLLIRLKAFSCWYLQGSYVEAASQLRGCLQALGRPLPTTKFDLFASFFWNLLRQLLHRFYIGQWLEMRAGGIWRGISSHDIKVSARDAAVVYHKLLQLHLTGKHWLIWHTGVWCRVSCWFHASWCTRFAEVSRHCMESINCGAWWLIGSFVAFRPKGREFESCSSRHVVTLGKSVTRSCLCLFDVKLQHSIHAVLGGPLNGSGL